MSEGVPLTPELMGAIEPGLAARRARLGSDCLSELSFSNFLLFRDVHRYRYFPGEHAHIVGLTYDGARHVTPLFDPVAAAANTLAGLLDDRDCLYPLAAAEIATLDPRRFSCSSVRDDSDYRYPASVFRDYEGTELRKKRQAVAQLQAKHRLSREPLTPARRSEALTVLQGWMDDKGMRAGEADEAACIEAIDNAELFGFEGWLFRADDVAAGFVLAQPLASGTMVMRFAKGLDACPGIYPHMFQACCRHWDEAVAWLNFEQDLGNPNFRRTKLSYQPDSLLEKYRVRLRCTDPGDA